MDMARVWPIVMQFGVGGIMCAVGVWCGLRSGYLNLEYRADRRLIGLIVAGYFGLLILLSLFTFWLPFVPAENAR
ncbi:MAG: hypothetical protein AMXMBFR4_28450 [Candidatus Hydrogenedentota bacterium]